jgi:hypothetical protein
MVKTSTRSFRKPSSIEITEQDLFGSNWPLGYAAGDTNLYRYVGNNPLIETDPSGLCERYATGEMTGGVTTQQTTSPAEKITPIKSPSEYSKLKESLDDLLLGNNPTVEKLDEASRIAQQVQQYWTNHATNWKISNAYNDEWPSSQRASGYWCYQWAFGFESAITSVIGPNFACKVEYCAATSGAVHFWVTIWAINDPTMQVYVDDGFGNGCKINSGTSKGEGRPIPSGYQYQGLGTKDIFKKFVPIPGYMPPE